MTVNTATYRQILRQAAEHGARLVTVTKQRPLDVLRELYDLGQRDFGENRTEELSRKAAELPDDIRWHFIGHLQRNKVRDMIDHTAVVHSGDSLRLLRELDKRAAAVDRTPDVLLQFHIAREESKYGLDRSSGWELMRSVRETPLSHVRLTGVMGMATYTRDEEQVAAEFHTLRTLFYDLQRDFFADDPAFREISMGMSGDYEVALQQGSTLLRVGSALYR